MADDHSTEPNATTDLGSTWVTRRVPANSVAALPPVADATGAAHESGLKTRRGGQDDELSRTFAALADPTRRAMLARLAEGEATVTELAEPFAMSMPAISKHLKVLERAGLITRGRDAQWRPCRLDAAPLGQATDWLDRYRKFWDTRFDRLDEHLKRLQKKDPSR